jgi:NADH:ubiquinone oxidoreductase subunit E
MIVQELYRIQSRHGYLPRADLEALAERLALPLYRIQEVVSFFPHYRTTPPPAIEIQVCRDMACQLRGSAEIAEALSSVVGKRPDSAQVRFVSCLGRCDRAPAVRFACHAEATGDTHGHAVHTLLARSRDELCAAARSLVSGPGIDSIPHDSDTDYSAVDCEKWRINVYAGQPANMIFFSFCM